MTPRHVAPSTRSASSRVLPALGVLLIGLGVAVAAWPTSAGAASDTGSSVTVTGTGRFAGLSVTVAKTRNLINEVVPISWSGANPTYPDSGQFQTNYLQIMQCWGDVPSGPDRSQCVFGGLAGADNRGGDYTTTRQLNYGASLVDPKETVKSSDPNVTVFAPFTSVSGKTVESNSNQYFDANTTNEIAFGRTRADRTGQEFFEMQTVRESAGLGCGAVLDHGVARNCWLVIVPRDDVEVDGSTVPLLRSSPLSQSNWDNRLVVPLTFAKVGQVCPIGSAERRTSGAETLVEAIGSWQPALCADGGTVFGFSQVADSVAKRQLNTSVPEMAFLTTPVPKDQTSATKPLVYAPIALSGLTISFLIESQGGPNAPPEVKSQEGLRLSDVKLTPRLVAKLLTQSYRLAVDTTVGYLKDNPYDLTKDPDFLAINPTFKDLSFSRGVPDVLVPEGLADVNAQLWAYVASDEDAMNFVQGLPDPWGMRVNPAYQGLSLPTDQFPKADPFCKTFPNGQGPLCTLDQHSYAADMHDAARSAGRGDPLARANWDPLAIPPQYKKTGVIPGGRRALMAFADTATADRYGLVPAQLRNASGHFVSPSPTSLLAGYAAMTPSDPSGVLAPDPASLDANAYPLTTVTYAVTVPSALSAQEATDYSTFIKYAVTQGQQPGVDPGELPAGYVPLPPTARDTALAAAAAILARTGVASSPTASSGPTASSSSTPSSSPTRKPSTPVSSVAATIPSTQGHVGSGGAAGIPATPPAAVPSSAATPSASISATSSPTMAPVAVVAATPVTPVANSRLALVAALLLGGVAALIGPSLPWVSRRFSP